MGAFSVLTLCTGFFGSADNRAALFAGNSYGMAAISVGGICGFRFGMVADNRRNGDGDFHIFRSRLGTVCHKHFFNSANKLRSLFGAYIFLCCKGYFCVFPCRNGALSQKLGMGYFHIGSLGILLGIGRYISVGTGKSTLFIAKKLIIKIQSCLKGCNIHNSFFKRKCDCNIFTRVYSSFIRSGNKTLCKSRYCCAKRKNNRKNKR